MNDLLESVDTVVVTAQLPGAHPKTIAETAATPLEEQINGTGDMLYRFSQAASDGTLTLTITFKLGTDANLAQPLVQNRVNQALPHIVNFLGIDAATLKEELATGKGDAETLTFFAEMVGKFSRTRENLKAWADVLGLDDYGTFGGRP